MAFRARCLRPDTPGIESVDFCKSGPAQGVASRYHLLIPEGFREVPGTPINGIKLRRFEAFPCSEGPREPGRKAAPRTICAGPNRRSKGLGGLS